MKLNNFEPSRKSNLLANFFFFPIAARLAFSTRFRSGERSLLGDLSRPGEASRSSALDKFKRLFSFCVKPGLVFES